LESIHLGKALWSPDHLHEREMPIDSTKKIPWPLYFVLVVLGIAALCFSFVDICPLIEIVLPSLKINKSTIINFILSLGFFLFAILPFPVFRTSCQPSAKLHAELENL
jgi:hypothetical protein